MGKDLNELRVEIDAIDRQMVELFRRRMDTVNQVAAYKQERGLPVRDLNRERALLGKVAQLAGEDLAESIQLVYRSIMAAARSYEHQQMGSHSVIGDQVKQALETTPNLFPQRPKVACQGIEGAYSQIACDHIFKSPAIQYYSTFDRVFRAVEEGECQYGVLPIENSTAGSVQAVYDLMVKHNFYIARSARLKISHNLLAPKGTRVEDIREIFSHQQAISQCSRFLSGLEGIKVNVVENTAVAANLVAQSGRTDVAALSSRNCAELYGLSILEEDVQDQENNYTRFICIAKQLEVYPGADRTTLMMTIPHQPGSLYNVLAKFYALDVNLRKLESRPLPNREFEFMFYFDIECSVYAPEFQQLLSELEPEIEWLRYLGSYNEVIC